MTCMPTEIVAADQKIEATVASSPVTLAAAFKAIAKHAGELHFNVENEPDRKVFLDWLPAVTYDLELFDETEIEADGGLGPKGLALANALLEKKKFDIRLQGPGSPGDVFAAATALFVGTFHIAGKKHPFPNGTPGFVLKAAGNKMRFVRSDSGGVTAVIRDQRGDLLFLSQSERVSARQAELASSVYMPSNDAIFQDEAVYVGIHCPMVDFDVKPDIGYIVGMSGQAGDLPFVVAQALMQTRLALRETGYKAEAAAAVAVSRGIGPGVDTAGYLAFDPTKPLAVWLKRRGAQLPHFAALVHPRDYKEPTA